MKIAIIGYGKMGKSIEQTARQRKIEIASIIDPAAQRATHKEISRESLQNADVCVDFSIPSTAIENIKKISALNKNIVIGTTGWYDKIAEAENIIRNAGNGMIWSGNFSIGVNMFFRIIENAAKIVDKVEDYDISGYEIHHKMKADSPSGTAEMIGKILLSNIRRKDNLVFDRLNRKIEPNELHLASIRYGNVPGTHAVNFDSSADTIELKHTARTREGFALGAVMAAEWINGKKGFYSINDMMDEIIKE